MIRDQQTTIRPELLPILMAACLFLSLLTGCAQGGKADAEAAAKAEKPGGEEKPAEAEKEALLPTVAVGTAQRGDIEQTLPVSGVLSIPRDRLASLSAPVAGVIDELPVRFGQEVVAGQVVARLSTRQLLGQIAQARATVAQNSVQVQQTEANAVQQQGQTRSAVLQARSAISVAEANLLGAQATLTGNEASAKNASENLTRTQTLFQDGLVARKDVEAAELAVRSAEAQVAAQKQTIAAQEKTVLSLRQAEQAATLGRYQDAVKKKDIQIARQQLEGARGALETALSQLSLYTIRAPLSGTVTAINAHVGEALDTATRFLTISDPALLQLQIAVPTASAGAVRIGQTVTFSVDALPNRTFRAVIRDIGKQIDPATSTLTAFALVQNPRRELKGDMAARVGLVLARHPGALLVPKAAVLYTAGTTGSKPNVLKVDKEGAVHAAEVTTGFTDDHSVEILSGVNEGEQVVTTGGYGLPDGTKVQIEGAEKKEAEGKRP